MTIRDDQQGGTEKAQAPRPPRLSSCFAMLGLFWLLLLAAWYGLGRIEVDIATASLTSLAVAAVIVAAVAALLWEIRRWLMRTLTSLPFSVALLAFLLVLTVAGTVIAQQAPPDAYVARHGKVIASLLLALGMDDLFRTGWFAGLLALLPVSLVLTAIEKRAWRMPMWGHLLSHIGFVTVLVGGWIGSRYGFKGVIDLHEGEVVQEARLTGKNGAPAGNHPLGFSLKLEKFAVENYVAEAKFYVYERDGTGYRGVRSFDVKEAATRRAIRSSGASFRLVKAYPDFYLKPEVRDVPAGTGGAVLQVDFQQGDWSSRIALQAGVTGRDATPLSAEGPPARFIWATPSAAEIARFTEGAPERHLVVFQGPGAGAVAEEVAVSVGRTDALPKGGFDVQVLEYLPDFTYDSKAKKASTRSQEPKNPALHVLIRDQKTREEKARWLFARNPDFGHSEGDTKGPRFIYRFEPARQPAARELLILGEARQLWRLEKGQVLERLPLEQWKTACAGLPVSGMEVHASAVVETIPTTRSEAWENPVADVVIEEGGASREVRFNAQHSQPVALADGKTFLAFELRADEPKAFRSHLTILEGGKTITEKTIVVNDPLSYKGFMFYQSNFRKEDPTYSGIQVVRDPGLGIVFLGFIMMSLGVVFIYYIRPRLIAGDSHGN